MPIKPENRHRYPPDWPQIVARIRLRSGNRCEQCGAANGELGGRDRQGNWHKARPVGEKLLRLEWPRPGTMWWCADGEQHRIVRIVLTTAHLDHVPEHCGDENLRHWCQRCHLRYDHEHHKRNAAQTRLSRKAVGDLFDAQANESTQ